MTQMFGINCAGYGDADIMHWQLCPKPMPKADEVLIKIAYAGINRADILQRQGKYPPPKGASDLLGLEVSGTIVAVGNAVSRWRVGDRVCALLEGGGYAEYAAAPAGQCLPVPDNLTMVEAGGLPEGLFTVWANLFDAGGLAEDQTVLIHGGGGGIGSLAIQMATAIGAKVIATAGSDEKCEVMRKLGAEIAINYKKQDFVQVMGERRVDIVLDVVGGDYVGRNLSILAPRGRHISIAVQSGMLTTINLLEVMQKRLILTGSTMRGRGHAEKAILAQNIEEKIFHFILKNRIKPLIHEVFDIKNAGQAHKKMEINAHIGKMVLEVT